MTSGALLLDGKTDGVLRETVLYTRLARTTGEGEDQAYLRASKGGRSDRSSLNRNLQSVGERAHHCVSAAPPTHPVLHPLSCGWKKLFKAVTHEDSFS